MRSVFWPVDLESTQGFAYGWQTPSLCVAGILNAESQAEAEQHLNALLTLELPVSLSICGQHPVVLGRWADRFVSFLNPRETFTCILYHRHKSRSLRFYSLEPLILDTEANSSHHDATNNTSSFSEFLNSDPTRTPLLSGGLDNVTINQFNAAKELESLLHHDHQPENQSFFQVITGALANTAIYASRSTSLVSSTLTRLFNTTVPFTNSSAAIKDASAILHQLDLRIEQVDFLTHQAPTLTLRPSTSIESFSARYVNFYNLVWLILNDITIGTTFGSFLCDNHGIIADRLEGAVMVYLVQNLKSGLVWLDSWPAGLKLNTELSRFYSQSCIRAVDVWAGFFAQLSPHMPNVIYAIGICSMMGGMTLGVSMLSDLLALLTSHIYLCYLLCTTVYRRQLLTAGSLWNLFRGKRYNVLRDRLDSWEYDIDQLLFGTILFTLLAFLSPTVIAYHSLFALMRVATVLAHAIIDTVLAFMNHFPLFSILLRVKDPRRLPGGVYFKPHRDSFVIENSPIAMSTIFYQYLRLWSKLSSHYNPLRLAKSLVTGEYVGVIPRQGIRYHKVTLRDRG